MDAMEISSLSPSALTKAPSVLIIMRRREARMEFVCQINQDSVTISPNYSEAQGYILLSLIGIENICIRLGEQ